MSQSKKTTGSGDSKPIADVAHPGTTAPSDTSKPIINQRPMMKDPMVVEEDKPEDTPKKPLPKKTSKAKIMPPEEPASAAEPPESDTEPEADTVSEVDPKADDTDKGPPKADPDAAAAAEAAKDAKLQKLVDGKKYFLPINAVEQRRSKRVVTIGFILTLVLALAWVDVALDAGLIQLEGIKPVTHFFSN